MYAQRKLQCWLHKVDTAFTELIRYLQSGTLIRQFTYAIQNDVHNFLADGVMPTGVVISGIFFPRY